MMSGRGHRRVVTGHSHVVDLDNVLQDVTVFGWKTTASTEQKPVNAGPEDGALLFIALVVKHANSGV